MDLGDWTKADVRVALLGDSTLDNILWIGAVPCISEQLTTSLPCAVKNLAGDGFKTTDTLVGSRMVISTAMRQACGDPVDFDADGVFRPLEALKRLAPPPTHVVLSVGGNDVREILGNIGKLPTIMEGFWQNYPALVKACLAVTPNVILQWQYRPSVSEDHHYGVYRAISALPGPGNGVEKLNQLMTTIYEPMLALARELCLPIVDLPRTFDIHDSDLYCSQIEPSAKGGAVISALLRHVVLNHPAGKASALYQLLPCLAESGKVIEEANDGRPWTIPA